MDGWFYMICATPTRRMDFVTRHGDRVAVCDDITTNSDLTMTDVSTMQEVMPADHVASTTTGQSGSCLDSIGH